MHKAQSPRLGVLREVTSPQQQSHQRPTRCPLSRRHTVTPLLLLIKQVILILIKQVILRAPLVLGFISQERCFGFPQVSL